MTQPRKDGCREEILAAARRIHAAGHPDFSPSGILRQMQRDGTQYETSTVLTHVQSRMCADAPDNHGPHTPTWSVWREAISPSRRPRNLGSPA